jgi:hypothetical protein
LLEYVPPINKIYVNQVSAMFLLQEDLITWIVKGLPVIV